MSPRAAPRHSVYVEGLYALLNPIPFGCFVAAMIFDIVYAENAGMLWNKGASWLIVFALLFAIAPRVVNLTRVWITARHIATRTDKLDFWLNLIGILLAILNAFVHSRDAYAVVPAGLWLSVSTVVLLSIANIALAAQRVTSGSYARD